MERASKPYRRRRCSLGAQACHSPRDGSECRAIGSEAASSKATSPTRSDLSNHQHGTWVPSSQREGSGAETCPVCLESACAWQPGLLRTSVGILDVARHVVAQSTPSPVLQARRIPKRETHLAVGKGRALTVIHNPVTTQVPGRWLAEIAIAYTADQGNTRQVHSQHLSASKSGDEVVQKVGIAGPPYSASHCSVAALGGPPALSFARSTA
jgi:hypothetical protein